MGRYYENVALCKGLAAQKSEIERAASNDLLRIWPVSKRVDVSGETMTRGAPWKPQSWRLASRKGPVLNCLGRRLIKAIAIANRLAGTI
jgi:hypothetical protein